MTREDWTIALRLLGRMPCANRETAQEKAAAHEWMERERQSAAGVRRRNRQLQILENFRREREKRP
jgi:hypothetical protein